MCVCNYFTFISCMYLISILLSSTRYAFLSSSQRVSHSLIYSHVSHTQKAMSFKQP